MPSDFEMSLMFGGRRYTNAKRGFRAFAEKMGKNVRSFNPAIQRELKDLLDTIVAAMTMRHSTAWQTGRTMPVGKGGKLQRRSGRGMASLKKGVRITGTGDNISGSISGLKYLGTHEKGAEITPKKGKFLTVPLAAALKADGTPKKRKARDWKNTFVIRSEKTGGLLICQKKGRKLVPLYALRRRVTIPARLGLAATAAVAVPVFESRLFDKLTKEFLKGL